jgi:hypothetical protein
MDSVWFLGNGREAVRQQGWFLHAATGQNIRTADLPLPFTKRMAHQFMEAPAGLTVEAALRWGQIHGFGSTERLARAIIGTRLGTDFEHDDFWTTVLQFFIANPMLDLAQVGPMRADWYGFKPVSRARRKKRLDLGRFVHRGASRALAMARLA